MCLLKTCQIRGLAFFTSSYVLWRENCEYADYLQFIYLKHVCCQEFHYLVRASQIAVAGYVVSGQRPKIQAYADYVIATGSPGLFSGFVSQNQEEKSEALQCCKQEKK